MKQLNEKEDFNCVSFSKIKGEMDAKLKEESGNDEAAVGSSAVWAKIRKDYDDQNPANVTLVYDFIDSDKVAQAEQETIKLGDIPEFGLLPAKILSFLYDKETQMKDLEEKIIQRKKETDPDW